MFRLGRIHLMGDSLDPLLLHQIDGNAVSTRRAEPPVDWLQRVQ
jgi:hypothetical protein